ncbi:MAG TPA: histidine kinase, partial [Caldimonas sp.]
PALSLQPLVENAIVHGLEPLISGGTIRIAARLERGALVLTVEDDGAGIQAENQATEAQLRLLQAQIEPHFLFNTLANVVGLIEADPPRAKLMLESFIDYLRSSLGGLRGERHTLGEEIDLIDAYLRVIAIRMAHRLHYEIDVPDALRALPLPALSLQPLVENAVVHGLEPKIEGGRVRVDAREANGLISSSPPTAPRSPDSRASTCPG